MQTNVTVTLKKNLTLRKIIPKLCIKNSEFFDESILYESTWTGLISELVSEYLLQTSY